MQSSDPSSPLSPQYVVSIVITHYDHARDKADGRFLSDGLLSRLGSILTQFLPYEVVNEVIRLLGQRVRQEQDDDAHIDAVEDTVCSTDKQRTWGNGFDLKDREKLLRLLKRFLDVELSSVADVGSPARSLHEAKESEKESGS